MTEEQKALSDAIQPKPESEVPAEEKAEEQKPEGNSEEQKTEEEQVEQEPVEKQDEQESKEVKPAEEEKEEPAKQGEEDKKKDNKEEKPKQEKPEPNIERKRIAENVVLVGKKPTMSYVLAAVTQFSDGIDSVHIKARGRSISRAVDVAEVVKNRFVQGLKTEVNIDTEEITDDNNNKLNVSTIDIALSK